MANRKIITYYGFFGYLFSNAFDRERGKISKYFEVEIGKD